MQIDNVFKLRSGARLSYARYGRVKGIPAFYFHGLPGSRREGILMHESCLSLGVDLIAVDRPGYGNSDLTTDHRLGHWPLSIAELADHLGFSDFYLFAVSGGAPYALACASKLRERVLGTGICCGLGEVARPELRDGMSVFTRFAFYLAQLNPMLLKYSYGLAIEVFARLMPRLAIDLLACMQGEPDRSILRQTEIKTIFADNLQEAFRQGHVGALADICTALKPWPFEITSVGALWLWHGTLDKVVPLLDSQWLAKTLGNAALAVIADEGHFSLPIRYTEAVVKSVIATR